MLVNDEPKFVEQDKLNSWVRLSILFAMGVIGTVGMWSVVVVLPALQNEFNLDRGNASLLYAATMVGFGLGNFLIGKVTDRLGVKIPIIVATILLIVSYLLAIISNQFWQLLVLQVFMGLSSATFFGPFMADIGNYFNRRRGLAVSIVGSANYIAGAIWPLLISYFLSFGNWKDVYLGIAVICFIIMLPLILILKDNRVKHNNTDINIGLGNSINGSFSQKKLQCLLMVAGVGCCVAMAMPQVHIVALCVDSGFGLSVGAEVLSVMLFSGMISRVASGVLSDKIGPVFTLFIGSLLQMISLVFFLPFDSQNALYIVSFMFGLSQGGIVPAYAMIVRKYLPLSEVGERVGLVIMATIVGMGLGGWMSGEIYDLTQSYKYAFVNGIVWNLINVLIVSYIMWKVIFSKNNISKAN